MYALYIEQREISGIHLLSWDLAHHLYVRSTRDKVIIATDKPLELLSATRKQWLKLMRQVMRQRSSTLDVVRSVGMTEQVCYMQGLRFSAKRPTDFLEADVTFATAADLIKATPICYMAYITYDISKEAQHMLTSWMPSGSVVVIYTNALPVKINNPRKELKSGANARATNQKSYQAALR